ncbi:hypothetical protein HXX76_011427 [Chlamydomonas incerta]|uniref:Uncharacterized protein n=1 Tax=Chlamydomonas incerta TaxID=51695 RepID=A0A835SKD9_CHLIN|nr:hypothetical protein HXX76_011427 [Chlamydomonas incerta]|eukprot:KAG2428723.1 hypothetical protein HXX76_011427 [Chlamydomonas incerta]
MQNKVHVRGAVGEVAEAMLPDETNHLSAIISGGLALLPHLVKLTLPNWSLLGALGDMRRRREAAAAAAAGPAAGGGGQASGDGDYYWLSKLQELEISSDDHEPITDEIAAGVASLRSLRILRLRRCAAPENGAGLLPLPNQPPPSLERLSVLTRTGEGILGSGLDACIEEGQLKMPHEAAIVAVKDLVQRCGTVEVREVEFETYTHQPALLQAAELLLQPRALRLVALRSYILAVPVHQQGGTARGAAVVGAAAHNPPLLQPLQPQQQQQQQLAAVPPLAPSLPSPQAVVVRAVQRLLARPRVPAPAAGGPKPPSGVAQLLVLQGPLVAGLAQALELLVSWGLGGPVLLLPVGARAGAGAAAALHAAVQSVDEKAQLDAAWIAVKRYPGYQGSSNYKLLPASLLWCIQQELDNIWALGTGGGAASRGAAAPTSTAHAPPSLLQEQAQWLLQLGKVLSEELPQHAHVSFEASDD